MERVRVIIVGFTIAVMAACGLLPGRSGEVIHAPTEVGEPEGAAVTKEIGPAGGTLSSADGRMTLTVPSNALATNMTFSIQPISNNAPDGIGSAYRLEPSGKAFEPALQLSMNYRKEDLGGTYPQALRFSYQDEKGSWHEPSATTVDTANARISLATAHLSDWSLNSGNGYRIVPGKATVYVGQAVSIYAKECTVDAIAFWLLRNPGNQRRSCYPSGGEFTLRGPGTITAGTLGHVVYTAPSRKPTPPVATVIFRINSAVPVPEDIGYLETEIIILDHAYRAKGQIGDARYSGVICSLDEPFTIHGTNVGYPITYDFNFTPSSSIGGTVVFEAAGHLVWGEGNLSYTIEGRDSDLPRIVITGTTTGHAPVGSVSKAGSSTIQLYPLDTDECTAPAQPRTLTQPPPPRRNPDMRGRKYKVL